MNEALPSPVSRVPRWGSFQQELPFHPSGVFPVGNMDCMAMIGDQMDFPDASASPVYGSFSSTGASDIMDSMVLGDESSPGPWTPAARYSGQLSSSTSFAPDPWNPPAMDSTVSPKMLRLNPSPTPPSSTESVNTSFISLAEADPAVSFDGGALPAAAQRPRKQLPDNRPRYIPILPSDPAHPRSRQTSGSMRGSDRGRVSASASASGSGSIDAKPGQHKQKHAGDRPKPQPATVEMPPGLEHERSRKDEFLIASKRAGMTYKEIRRKGGFTEAESTLRGRFRTLTKNKEARVRKPEWEDIDVSWQPTPRC